MNKVYTLGELAKLTNGNVFGNADLELKGVSPIETASKTDICLAKSKEYIDKIPTSKSIAFIVGKNPEIDGINFLVHTNPYAAFAKIISQFYPLEKKGHKIDDSAVIGKDFTYEESVFLGANTVIGDNVSFGKNIIIKPGSVICDNVKILDDTIIHPNVTIYSNVEIGKRCIIHSSSVIGSDGFGFAPDLGEWIKVNHQGGVKIDDDVEIGASNTIDRGTFGDTIIGKGVKTDNQVHIAHNVEVGESTILIGQSGIAGSTKIGKKCIVAGKAGISGHLKIGNNVIIGPMSGVTRDVKDGNIVSGIPEMPHKLWLKVSGLITRLPNLRKKIFNIEKRIKDLEDK